MNVKRNVHGWPFFDSIKARLRGRIMPVTIAGSGRPILFLHGFPLDRRMWDSAIEVLARDYLCIAPDLRGFGRSAEERFSYTLADLARDCHQLLSVLQIHQPITVCGLSMGGYIAMEFVRQFGNSVDSVILANTKAEVDAAPARTARFASANGALRNGAPSVTLSMRERLVASTTSSGQPGVMSLLEAMLVETPASTVAWAQLAMLARSDFTAKIKDWAIPTLCVAGDGDVIVPVETMTKMCASIPQGHFEVIENAGHLTPMEQPALFAKAVHQFLTNSVDKHR